MILLGNKLERGLDQGAEGLRDAMGAIEQARAIAAAVQASEKLQQLGSKVFIIGVGDALNNKGDIDQVASQPASKYVVYAQHWEDVAGLIHDFIKGFCPTPPPMPEYILDA